ncbi:MAG: RluA family pseudouridine synthase [Burkholderiaceae bacterium]
MELAHRLDRDTSGLLMIAKTRPALVALHAMLRERQVDKRYLAIVAGRWPRRTRTLDGSLRRYLTASGERRVAVDDDGRVAITHVTGLAHRSLPELGVFSRVAVEIETGRTHRIRVHLAEARHPIAGDQKYGDFALNRALAQAGHRRLYLHMPGA